MLNKYKKKEMRFRIREQNKSGELGEKRAETEEDCCEKGGATIIKGKFKCGRNHQNPEFQSDTTTE